MSRLADAFLHHRAKATRYDAHVIAHLAMPSPELSRHLSIEMLHRVAERIVYLDDIPSLLKQLEDNKQIEMNGMLHTVKLPFDCYWIEYRTRAPEMMPEPHWHWGALFERRADGVYVFIVCGIPFRGMLVAALSYVVRFAKWPPMYLRNGKGALGFEILFAFDADAIEGRSKTRTSADATYALYMVLTDLLFGSFLVTQPKVLEEVRIVPTRALQKARRAAGKPPLFEYRRLKVKIGDTRKVYSHERRATLPRNTDPTDSERAIQHRRYHKVMGHFRHYTKDNPHTVWIEPHYRGDPMIGVTFTEREVSK